MFRAFFAATIEIRSPLISCKRNTYNGTRPRKVLPYKDFIKFNDHRRVLQHTLGIKTLCAIDILLNKPQMLNLPIEYLAWQCKALLKWNYDPLLLLEDTSPIVESERNLENVAMWLKDAGAQMKHPPTMKSFTKSMLAPMFIFKAAVKIPFDDIVAKNFLECIKQPEEGVEPLTIPDETLRAYDYHQHCLRWYIKWKLNVREENEKEMTKMLNSLRNRSFTIMEELFEICHNEVGLSVEEIKKHRCLASGSPSNLRLIIDEREVFNGREMKKLIKLRPKLIKMVYGNVIQVIKLLEKHSVTEMAIQKYPLILLANASDLEFKLKAIDASPETRILKNNVKAIEMMTNRDFNRSQIRLNCLRYLNIKFATVRLLCSPPKDFEKFLARGQDRTRCTEISLSFEKVLNIEPNVLLAKLRKHPYWNHIDLLSMHDTAEFLKERGFRVEDITANVPILLYPREKIAAALESLAEGRSGEKKSSKRSKAWTGTQKLALCLYEIEREFHFSNDGIWREENLVPNRSPKRFETFPDNDESSEEIVGEEKTSETS